MREDYLMDSDRAGRFLDEDKYEWGHPDNLQLKPHRPNHDFPLAKACREWRLRIHADELGAPKGSFDGWRILMCVDGDNKDQVDRSGAFQRIFEVIYVAVMQLNPMLANSRGKATLHPCRFLIFERPRLIRRCYLFYFFHRY